MQTTLNLSTPSSMTLRPYQADALAELETAIGMGDHPVAGCPTGSGKSVLIAALSADLAGRVLVVTHRKELLTQNSGILERWLPGADYGIYSAGLDRRETDSRVIFGGIQSIYRRLDELQASGEFGAVIVDEAHRVTTRDTDSMYSRVLGQCPDAVRVGFTATPYRLQDGPIYGQDNTWFTCMPVHITLIELVQQGYLSPLVGVQTAGDVPLSGVRTQAGEFVLSDLSQSASEEAVVNRALDELCTLADDRKAWMVFCVDVAHTELITRQLRGRGIDAEMIVGATPAVERNNLLGEFREGRLRVLVNCLVGTEGFDIPRVDCVAMLRPSLSKGLVVQMIGRAARLFDGKDNALVLDLAGNLERHVPLDGIPEWGKSPAREKMEQKEAEELERQAREARERQPKHGYLASEVDPMTGVPYPPVELDVYRVFVDTTPSKKYRGKTNIRVRYLCYADGGQKRWVSQWLCPEYTGFAQEQARAWFGRRQIAMHVSAEMGVRMAKNAPLPLSILVEQRGGWDRIKMEYF